MGILALMGSGEFTATMVEVHKMLLSRLPVTPVATFLDTPAGFQLNVDQIAAGATDYFRKRVGFPLGIASYKSHDATSGIDAMLAFRRLRESDFILMGPGSPTYTVDQLRHSPIPGILVDHVRGGGCLVAASAAALTVGRYTLPVYEIYKVGQPLHWVAGLDILGALGLNLVVVPHWNNAEGGSHDTSRCYMGKSRFEKLTAILEESVPVLGLDEHTACIIDLADATFHIRGIGTAVYTHMDHTRRFTPGKIYALDMLRGSSPVSGEAVAAQAHKRTSVPENSGDHDFWRRVHAQENRFHRGISSGDVRQSAKSLLELDRTLWQAQGDLENPDIIAQARDLFRELLVVIGTRSRPTTAALERALTPVVDNLLASRQRFRDEHEYAAADALRDALASAGIVVEDGPIGTRWRLAERKEEAHDQPS